MPIVASVCADYSPLDTSDGMGLPEGTPIDRRSIFTDCIHEADRFKWIESEKAGRPRPRRGGH